MFSFLRVGVYCTLIAASALNAFGVTIYGTPAPLTSNNDSTNAGTATATSNVATAQISWTITFSAGIYTYDYSVALNGMGSLPNADIYDIILDSPLGGCFSSPSSCYTSTKIGFNPGSGGSVTPTPIANNTDNSLLPAAIADSLKFVVPTTPTNFRFNNIILSFTSTLAPVWGDFAFDAASGTTATSTSAAVWDSGLTNHVSSTAFVPVPDFVATPEPAALALCGAGLVAFACFRRRRVH